MRAQFIVAASLVLVAVVDAHFAEQLHKFKLQSEAKIAKMTTSARMFHPQQSSGDLLALLKPASDDPVCQEAGFSALVISIGDPCQKSTLPILNSSLAPTLDTHRAAWNSYCSSSCINLIKTSVIGSKYWICLQPLIQYFASEANYLCSSKDSNDDYCGLAISRLSFASACSYTQTSTKCTAIGGGTCAWSQSRGCSVNPSQTLLTALCGTCLSGLIKEVNSKFPGLESAVGTIDGSKELCATAPSGAYCLPILATQLANSGTAIFESNAQMASFCTDDDKVACFGGYVASSAADTIASAQDGFVSCASFYSNVSASVTRSCLPQFFQEVSGAQSMSAVVGAMCTNYNGTYCIPAFFALSSDSSSGGGSSSGAQCPPGNATAVVAKLGCCLGTAQSLMTTMETLNSDPTLLPPIPGYTPPIVQQTAAPAPPTQHPVVVGSGEEISPNPGRGGFFALGACGVPGINESLRVRCAQNRFKVTKNLLVPLDYAAVTADPATKAAVLLSLRRDVAANAKVAPNQITDDSISPTTRVQVTTSARGMQVQATSNGVQYTYTVQASSKAQVQAASSNVDNAVNSGYLDMSNTQTTVEEKCTACVGSGGSASVSSAKSTTLGTSVQDTNGGGSSSGAAAVGTLLAIIFTILTLLC